MRTCLVAGSYYTLHSAICLTIKKILLRITMTNDHCEVNTVFYVYQVRVLELESQLQKEREKLGDLRKKHYELAGVSEGWGDGK